MNKIAKISIAVFVLILTILIALPFTINKPTVKFQIEQKISQKLGVNFAVKGNVGIRFLPIPQISLGEATATNLTISNEYYSDISVANLIIRPEIIALLRGQIKINSIIFENPKIENHYASTAPKDAEKDGKKDSAQPENTKTNNVTNNVVSNGIFNKILNFGNNNQEIFDFKNINSIRFKDGYFSKKNINDEIALEFTKINFSLTNQIKKQIFTIQGDFISGDMPTNFNLIANVKNDDDSTLTIQSPIINLILSGKFANSNISDLIKSNFSGKIDAEIIDLKALLNKYFSKNNPLFLKINATQPIRVSAEINNDDGEIKAEDIIIKSQIIDGSGKFSANLKTAKTKIAADFNFANIDIDNMWFSGSLNRNSKNIDIENEVIKKFTDSTSINIIDENKSRIIDPVVNKSEQSILDNLDLTAEIKVKTAKYYGNNLQDISLSFVADANGKILLQPFKAVVPGGSVVVNGSLEYDNNTPKLIGKIQINGHDLSQSLAWLKIDIDNLKPKILSDYRFTADLLTLPDFIVFNNLNLAINNNKNIIVGDLKIDDSTPISTSSANLRISYLNYDDYFLTNKQNPYLSSGSLLKKLLWLNTVSSSRNIYLLFDQLVYQGNNLTNQGLRIQFGQGYLKLSDLDISSPTFDLKGNVDVDISNNSPKLNIDLASNNFSVNARNSQKDSAETQFFNLPSLDEFSGKVNLNIANLTLNSWHGSEVVMAGKLKSGIVDLTNLNFKAYKGAIKYKGSIVFKDIKTINGSLELLGVDNNEFLSDIFDVQNISGIANISVTINSNGANKAEFLKNLNAKIQFVSANINIKGFGLYDLAAKMVQPKKYQEELTQPLKILYNNAAETPFKDASGAAEFKRGANKNQFNIKVGTNGINGVISGIIDDKLSFDGSGNFIFISGSRAKQIPINFAVNFNGKSGQIKQSTNLSQIEQYLGLPQTAPPTIASPVLDNAPIQKTPTAPANDNPQPTLPNPMNDAEKLIRQQN